MGAAGYVLDPEKPLGFTAWCRGCQGVIFPDEPPGDNHERCREHGRIWLGEVEREWADGHSDNFRWRGLD